MTDEIKAAAERLKQGCCQVRYGEGGPWYRDPQYANDAIVVAEAYIAEQAERALPITVEWLEPLCVTIGVGRRYWFLEERLYLTYKWVSEKFWVVINCEQIEVKTRGQLMDLCSLIGFKLGWHLEGKAKT